MNVKKTFGREFAVVWAVVIALFIFDLTHRIPPEYFGNYEQLAIAALALVTILAGYVFKLKSARIENDQS